MFCRHFQRLSNNVPASDRAFLRCEVDHAELLGLPPYMLRVALMDVIQ